MIDFTIFCSFFKSILVPDGMDNGRVVGDVTINDMRWEFLGKPKFVRLDKNTRIPIKTDPDLEYDVAKFDELLN